MPLSRIEISSLIGKFDKKLGEIIREDLKIIKDIKKNVIESGGKRIRPLTHYFLSVLLGYKGRDNILVGTVAELIHAASLLHDDVIDKAEMRRGKPTVGNLFGNKTAILAGDFLLACGIENLNRLHNPALMDSFTRVIRDLSVGELIQMQWEKDPAITEKIYDEIIYGKTASLFGAVCETAGILSGAETKKINSLRNFGISMGNMFQKRDDYLDYFDDSKKIGKIPYKDFYNGLYTYPVIVLRDLCTKNEKEIIRSIFALPERNSADAKVMEGLMVRYGISEMLRNEMASETMKLIEFLKKFPKNKFRTLMIERIEELT